jgi:predicted DNA-binding transcriptional regulator AlpA
MSLVTNGVMDEISSVGLVSAPGLLRLTKWSKPTLHRQMKKEDFPKPLRLSPGNPRSRLFFRLSEIREWLDKQQALTTAAENDAGAAGIHAAR